MVTKKMYKQTSSVHSSNVKDLLKFRCCCYFIFVFLFLLLQFNTDLNIQAGRSPLWIEKKIQCML